MSDETPKIQVGIRMPDEPWRREWLWAEPVEVRTAGGPGIYRLLNTAIYATYLVHDLVRARRSGHCLIVTALHRRGSRTGYDVHFPIGTPERDALALCDEWAAGCAVEGVGGLWFSLAVDHDAGERPTVQELQSLRAIGRLDELHPRQPAAV